MDILFSVPAGTATSDIRAVTNNIIGPVAGIPATADENSNPVPAVGDPKVAIYTSRLSNTQAATLAVAL